MDDLRFQVVSADVVAHSVTPEIALTVEAKAERAQVESILLRVTTRLETAGRSHEASERAHLVELFGDESAWGRTSRSLVWATSTVVVPRFDGSRRFEVSLPCSFDLAAIASKYLRALGGGTVPLRLQLAGTVFLRGAVGLEARPIPWDRDATFALSVDTFRDAIERVFPDAGAIALRRDVLDRLDGYRVAHHFGSYEESILHLLASTGARGAS